MQFLLRSSPWRQVFREQLDAAGQTPVSLPLLDEVMATRPRALDSTQVKDWQVKWVRRLVQLQLPAGQISQLISDHNAWLYRQAISASLAEMQAQGWGEPPVAFCVLILGSGARSESLLRPDQDNAMILDSYPPEQHQQIDTWFQHLGELFTDKLDQAGIPLCRGEVMARWPLWRKPLNEWQDQLRIWTGQRVVKKVQLSNILLDFAPVYGQEALARQFRESLHQWFPEARGFLQEMAGLLDEIPVGLDALDRLVTEDSEAPHSRALNLKRQAILPLQSAVRLYCLLEGEVEAVSTRERLTALVAAQQLTPDEGQDLMAVLEALQGLLLDAQLESLEAGRQADNWLSLEQLSERQTRLLKLDMKLIKRLVRQVAKRCG
ncbi:DUF294 nucleotidyltransferase-like domain-containing protein [Marinospirillum perlucidum]|uniref:DUF294 nucleotidyltransferase-like domain-containing protein n=1 Tax=Marinospirillum perlucidum TaxID=1982602 RepID=UPI000DF355D7|nr:DUF294 nucleotidyltransferase-like domain-containing protein [Marinospirillum perlucidum]